LLSPMSPWCWVIPSGPDRRPIARQSGWERRDNLDENWRPGGMIAAGCLNGKIFLALGLIVASFVVMLLLCLNLATPSNPQNEACDAAEQVPASIHSAM
jgi:hypothetical protein